MRLNNKKLAILDVILTVGLFTFLWNQGRIVGSLEVLLASSAFCGYLLLKNRFTDKMEWGTTNSISTLLDMFFLTLLGLIVLSLLTASPYVRPASFFVIVMIQCGLIGLDALTFRLENRRKQIIILLKLLIIAAILRWSLFYVFPGLIGVDPFSHVNFTQLMMSEGGIPTGIQLSQTNIDPYYLLFPVFHLCLMAASLITGMDLRSSMILSIGLFEVLSLSFIYLLGKKIFNARVGLIASLLVGVSSVHIKFGYWIIPMTFGLSLFTFILYALLANPEKLRSSKYALVLFSVLSLFTIPLNAIVCTITWLLFFFYRLVYLIKDKFPSRLWKTSFERKDTYFKVSMLLLMTFLLVMLGYWIYIADFFQRSVISLISYQFREEASLPLLSGQSVSSYFRISIEQFLDSVGTLSILVLSLFGALHLLSSKSFNVRKFSLVFIGGLFYIVYWVAERFNFLAIVPNRWLVFSEILLAVPSALGLILMTTCTKSKTKKAIITFMAIATITFFMITNTSCNFDNPLYTEYITLRFTFLSSETQAASFLSQKCNTTISTDAYYAENYYNATLGKTVTSINFASLQTSKTEGILVIRSYIIDNVFLTRGQIGVERIRLDYDPRRILENQSLMNRLYSNGAVTAYSNSSTPK